MAKRPSLPSSPANDPSKGDMFYRLDADDKVGRALALRQMGDALRASEPVIRSHGSNVYNNIAPDSVSIRDGLNRYDYESWRPEEARPLRAKDQMFACMRAYEQEGIVYNIVNLMADFACRGVTIHHPNERIEKWCKEWWRRISGRERSERFLNYLFRCGQVIPQRQTAKIPVRIERQMKRATADPDTEIEDEVTVVKREIPWRYVFLNPLSLHVTAEELVTFVGADFFQFALQVPPQVAARIRNPRDGDHPVIAGIPKDILTTLQGNTSNRVPLDPQKVTAYYFKRDDWRIWATPMISPILKDLNVLEKMKLADLAALDGAISCIRVWKLGNSELGIFPTEVAVSHLAGILQNNVGGGVMDLVWGPDISLVETSTEVHRFLGESKYHPTMRAIYQGLGIPSAGGHTGGVSGAGFNTDFFSLKILTDRLEYGRSVLDDFWATEFRIMQKAMGFRVPPTTRYAMPSLSDEAAQKKLLLDLADRDFISWETIVERFGESPEIEESRLRREMRRRKKGQMPPKASPYHDPQQEFAKEKAFIQLGEVTPSQVGLDLPDPKKGEKIPAARKPAAPVAKKTPTGVSGEGRPLNSKDTEKRKKKEVKPRSSASILEATAWAETAQSVIQDTVGPAYLKSLAKSNFRELSDSETRAFEDFKFRILCQCDLYSPIDEQVIKKAVSSSLGAPAPLVQLLKTTVSQHLKKNGREPTLPVLRRYQAGAYALWNVEVPEQEEEGAEEVGAF